MKTALLVIDMQQGLCEGEGAAWDTPIFVQRINGLSRQARLAGVPVIWIQHESETGDLEHGSPGWELAHGLQTEPHDLRVRKTTPDSFNATELASLLQAREIKHLAICGMHTEFCVDTTTRRALALGYPVTLVADAHTSAGNAVLSPAQVIAHHNATLTNISSFGPRVHAVLSTTMIFAN